MGDLVGEGGDDVVLAEDLEPRRADDDGPGANFRIARTLGSGRYYVRVERGSGEEESYTLTLDEAG